MSDGGSGVAGPGHVGEVMARHVERGDVPGLVALVSRRGTVHVDAIGTMAVGGAEVMRRDTIFRIASMTKPIAAAAAMILVDDRRLSLDDPVDRHLPELADRRVLRRLDSPLDDVVPARRPVSLRDLLTMRFGLGAVMAPPGCYPIQRALAVAGLEPGVNPPPLPMDDWMARLGALPLVHHPGDGWLYHTSSDVLGVLIQRAAGQSLESFLAERLFGPLGMRDTAFHVPAGERHRLPPSYGAGDSPGVLALHDDPLVGRWSRPPVFASAGGGLVSTVDDYLAFCRMLLDGGRHGSERILSRRSVEQMTTDQLTAEQRAGASDFLGQHAGWGFGMAVGLRRGDLATRPGRFGWDGGLGTSAYTDPAEGLIGILMTQRMMDSPDPPPLFRGFWTAAYRPVGD